MKVLVSGGTGFIGSAIVREILSEQRHEVTVLTRHLKNVSDKFAGLKVEAREGDVTSGDSLAEALSGIDCVIQCVQFPNHPVQNPKKGFTYEKVDAQGTENLCRAITKSTVKRVIYLSGAGTSPTRKEPWFKAKVRAEAAVKSTSKDYVILRPSWVYGPGDKSMSRFIDFAKFLPIMPVIGDGKSRVSPVYIGDLARICAQAVDSAEVRNKTINVGGPQTLTMNAIQKTVLDVLDKNKPLMHQPMSMMKAAAWLMEKTLPTPPLSPEALEFINMDIPVSSAEAEALFHTRFSTLESALKSYL